MPIQSPSFKRIEVLIHMLYELRLIRIERRPPLVSRIKRKRIVLVRYRHDSKLWTGSNVVSDYAIRKGNYILNDSSSSAIH